MTTAELEKLLVSGATVALADKKVGYAKQWYLNDVTIWSLFQKRGSKLKEAGKKAFSVYNGGMHMENLWRNRLETRASQASALALH